MNPHDEAEIRALLDDYLRMYACRDPRLTTFFSEDFSGFTGGGAFLVKNREEWADITRQDFAQVKEPIQLELKDVALQSLAPSVAVATSFFIIHLPIKDHVLSRETARLVLIFRKEPAGWKISHSSISIPYYLVREGEVYPLKELEDRNQQLQALVAEQTQQLSEANLRLRRTNDELTREIAERKQSEVALQASEARYRSILNASPDDITITDVEGRIVMVSPMALTMFHYTGAEVFLGRQVTDFLVPEDRARAASRVALKLQGVDTGPSEYRALRQDGSTFELEVNSELLRDAQGAPTGFVVIARDISERKRAEADRKTLEASHRQLQKMESLGRMAGAVAHHFNNQLHAVAMGLDLALGDLPAGTPAADSLTDALSAARKAAELSTLMLTYLGQSAGKHAVVELSEACRRHLSLVHSQLPELVLETHFPATGPRIKANEAELAQVLANLVTNAWEAMSGGRAAVHVSVRTVPLAELPVTNRFPVDSRLTEPAYACLEVADSGCGIAAEDFDKLFDPFFSTKFTGRGLGLPVVAGIARSHHGAVVVSSEPGRGSTFQVFFPLLAPDAPESAAAAQSFRNLPSGS